MAKNSIMLDLDDPRADKIAEIISNSTCKKILAALAEEDELSESEISEKLKIAMNTTEYNIKKLVDAGLIERSEKFFWSSKGKRMHKYRVSNKKIVISPITKLKGILPAVIASALIATGIWIAQGYSQTRETAVSRSMDYGNEAAGMLAQKAVNAPMAADSAAETGIVASQNSEGFVSALIHSPQAATWFLIGALAALFIFFMWNWGKKYEP